MTDTTPDYVVGAEDRRLAGMPTNVIQAIARIMAEMPPVGKNQQMTEGPKYAYRGIEDVTAAIQKLMGRYGVVPIAHPSNLKVQDIVVGGKPWTETTMDVFYDLCGPSWDPGIVGLGNDQITVGPFCAIARDNADKGTNKAMTQAFKQMLLQTFVVGEGGHDPDSYASQDRDTRQPDPEPIDWDKWTRDNGWESGMDGARAVREAVNRIIKERVEQGLIDRDQGLAMVREYARPDGPDTTPHPPTRDQHDTFLAKYGLDEAPPAQETAPSEPTSPPGAEDAPAAPDAPPEAQEAAQAPPARDLMAALEDSLATAGRGTAAAPETRPASGDPDDNGHRDELDDVYIGAGVNALVGAVAALKPKELHDALRARDGDGTSSPKGTAADMRAKLTGMIQDRARDASEPF